MHANMPQLEPFQIRAIARHYTDRQMMRLGNDRLRVGPDQRFWSNGFALFFEPPTAKMEKWSVDTKFYAENISYSGFLQGLGHSLSDSVVAFPVEVIPFGKNTNGPRKAVRFQNHGSHVWVDGRYVSAILKRCKKSKCQVSWAIHGDTLFALCDGKLIAVVMGLHVKDRDTQDLEWNLKAV